MESGELTSFFTALIENTLVYTSRMCIFSHYFCHGGVSLSTCFCYASGSCNSGFLLTLFWSCKFSASKLPVDLFCSLEWNVGIPKMLKFSSCRRRFLRKGTLFQISSLPKLLLP